MPTYRIRRFVNVREERRCHVTASNDEMAKVALAGTDWNAQQVWRHEGVEPDSQDALIDMERITKQDQTTGKIIASVPVVAAGRDAACMPYSWEAADLVKELAALKLHTEREDDCTISSALNHANEFDEIIERARALCKLAANA